MGPNEGEVSIEVDGKLHTGRYTVEKDIVTVAYGPGRKSTQLGGSPALTLARLMLKEMRVDDKK